MKKIKECFKFEVDGKYSGERLDKYINSQLDESTRSYIEKLIDTGYVLLDSKICKKNGKKLKTGNIVLVNIPEEEDIDINPENIPLKIIYEDENFILINKKYDMVVHPAYGNYTGTLVNALMYYTQNLSTVNGKIRPGIIHRLDKDTSGLIMVAKNNNSHAKLASMFVNKTVHKTYLCIVKGNFSEERREGRIENFVGRDIKDRKKMAIVEKNGKIAISNYKVIQQVDKYSLVEVEIETGRTHQIRIHMKSINHPILGDNIYGSSNDMAKRQMLHAYKLEFKNPIDDKDYEFTAPLFDDFIEIAEKLKFNVSMYK
ncbi:MAG: RluA family pseudouridine synthase [Fusobacterium sp.]|uniref:RluA family pseudouridine synthase n=1 Tax=Fusobacterium sp. TaxID=68766 RepID=UPI0026DCE680|nr:RluA family pseudouridine synthase [Fusobacterium sp.]MDO4690878.1 RluA family pseudouridine synthase [Fusobacterium sp.]